MFYIQRKDADDMAKGLTRCNVCGKTVEQVFENQMPISIHDRVGYGSKHDGSMLDLDICPDCFINNLIYLSAIYHCLIYSSPFSDLLLQKFI